MAIVTPEEYYSDEEQFGGYQYVPMKDIVDALEIEAQDDDSYLKNTKRYKILHHVKEGIKKVTKDAANDVLGFSITVPDNLTFALPQDYVNWVRVCVIVVDHVTGSKRLQPLNVNHRINTAIGYLQDHNAELLFDNDGYILQSDGDNAYGEPYKTYQFCEAGGQYGLDTSKLSEYGEFTIDERRGTMLFSSELMDREIVFEYISDGLQAQINEDQIKVHKHLVETITNWAFYACLAGKRNVPSNEKYRALQRFKTTMNEAKIDRADFDLLQIARTMRTKSL